MKEIGFSTMGIVPTSGAGETFFDSFTTHEHIGVKPLYIDWPDAWHQLILFGLNSRGPDVSEIGTTWLGSFHAMEVLRPFSMEEAALFGNQQQFPSALWQACCLHQNNIILSIPFTLDLRVALYRRDMFEKAGVDEAAAFTDSNCLFETLKRLQAAGHPGPLGLTTSQSLTRLIHDMACWVWDAGGDLRSQDGRRMMLLEPKSRAGIEAYFGLNEFIAPEMRALTEGQAVDAFLAGKSAVVIAAAHAYLQMLRDRAHISAEVADNIGVAMLMQVPYIGGSSLSVWRYSADYESSLKLIQYVTSLEAWQALNDQHMPYLPARLDALEKSPLGITPFYPAVQQSLQKGRSFHSGFRWNGVEGRLVAVIQQMWDDLRANPGLSIAREVEQRFSDVCKRLEETILVPTL